MTPQPISEQTRLRLERLFATEDRATAEQLLINECGNNLGFSRELTSIELERFRFAAMKLSQGNLMGLLEAIKLAKTDWRDLLMAADFGIDVTEHLRWWPTARSKK
jgi:hypothetical protein